MSESEALELWKDSLEVAREEYDGVQLSGDEEMRYILDRTRELISQHKAELGL